VAVASAEATRTVLADIRPTPIIRATVVAAVRPGLRRALAAASFTGTPNTLPGR
jgi:hypothetical protein